VIRRDCQDGLRQTRAIDSISPLQTQQLTTLA
jgi:hypothetical protein